MGNKLVKALQTDQELAFTPARPRSGGKQRKHIGGYFDPAVSTQLRHLAVEKNSTVQQLLEEALDLLFQMQGRPLIEQSPKILNVGHR